MDKLVSIITPCYNGEKYLERYFESILSQTYPSVELIFVNDGSSDCTETIAMSYGEKLKARGYSFTYIYQGNAGQSAAINKGLQVFRGDYLTWPDSDDYLPSDSIEVRVRYLESHPDAGMVIGSTVNVDNDTLAELGIVSKKASVKPENLFWHVFDSDFSWPCLSMMVRSEMFRDAMPNPLQIQTPRLIGQNNQLVLPILFKYPAAYIEDVTGFCTFRRGSHSHTQKTFEQKQKEIDVALTVLNNIADDIENDESKKSAVKKYIAQKILNDRLDSLFHYQRKDNLNSYVSELKAMGSYDSSAKRKVLKIKYPTLKRLGDMIWRMKQKVK